MLYLQSEEFNRLLDIKRKTMKLKELLLPLLVTLAFTTMVNADGYKLKVCERAETAFWDTIQNSNTNTDQSFIEILDEKDKVGYYKMSLGKIKASLTEVERRCKGSASKDILDAYEKKNSEIQGKINAL